jgi:hypothetical protein
MKKGTEWLETPKSWSAQVSNWDEAGIAPALHAKGEALIPYNQTGAAKTEK